MLDRTIAPAFQRVEKIDLVKAQTLTLSNGVKIHTINVGEQDILLVHVYAKGGIVHQPAPLISRMAASAIREGTINHSAKEIADTVSFYGAELDGAADAHYTKINLACLGKHFELLLPLFFEIAYHPTYPMEELERKKQQFQQNMLVNMQKTSWLASSALEGALYGTQHPYGRTPIAEDAENVFTESLKQFHSRTFANDLPEIVIAGKITDKHLQLLEEYFGARNYYPIENVAAPAAEGSIEMLHIVEKAGPQSTIRLAKLVPNRHHSDNAHLRMAAEALGGYFGSRLMKNIREEKGYTYGISARIKAETEFGNLVIGTDVGAEVTQAAINEIKLEMQRMIDEPLPAQELETVKIVMLSALASSFANVYDISSGFTRIHFLGLGYDYYNGLVDAYKHATSADIQAVAAKYFTTDNLYTIVAGSYQ
jgi:predicted Zn-dependent peptidase